MENIWKILSSLNITPIAVYPYGSRVYETNSSTSDYDYIVISSEPKESYLSKDVNITFYTTEEFQHKINNQDIDALECLFIPSDKEILSPLIFTHILDKSKLRESVSKKASNSWVKCKKKLTVEKDYDELIGKKSLFHSFRMVMFAIQIAKTGKIYDFSEANSLFFEIMQGSNDWNDLKLKYQERHNQLMSTFRVVAPKDV